MAELLNQKVLNALQFSSGRLDRWHCSCTLFPKSGATCDSDYDCKMTELQIFFQDWWAKVPNAAKIGGSFSEMMGPSISN